MSEFGDGKPGLPPREGPPDAYAPPQQPGSNPPGQYAAGQPAPQQPGSYPPPQQQGGYPPPQQPGSYPPAPGQPGPQQLPPGPGAPAQPGGQATSVLRDAFPGVSALDWGAVGKAAAISAGVSAGVAFALSLVIGVLSAPVLKHAFSGVGGVPGFGSSFTFSVNPEWFVAFTMAQIFGAPLLIKISIFGEYTGQAWWRPLTLTALVAVAAVVAGVFVRNRGLVTNRTSQIAAALLSGVGVAVALAIVALLGTSTSPGDGFGIGWPIAALQALLLIAVCHFIGTSIGAAPPVAKRLALRQDVAAPKWLGDVARLGVAYVAVGIAATVGAIIWLITSNIDPTGLSNDSTEDVGIDGIMSLIWSLLQVIAFFGNWLVVALSVCQLSVVQWQAGGSGFPVGLEGSAGVFGSESHPAIWLGVLLLAIAVVCAGTRMGLRRPPQAARGAAGIWRLPVAWAGIWLLLQWVGSAGVAGGGASFGAQVSGGASFGPGAFTFIAAGLWALVAELAARVLPGVLLGGAPGLARLIGGSRIDPGWLGQAPQPVAPTLYAGPTSAAAFGTTAGAAPGETVVAPNPTTSAVSGETVVAPNPTTPAVSGPTFAPPASHTTQTPASAPVPPAYRPMSPEAKRRARLILGLVGGVAAAIVAAVIAVTVINSTRTPEVAVQAYAQLIADGKATEANALVNPDVADAQRGFLTDEVLGSAKSRISNIKARPGPKVDGVEDERLVTLDYELGGETHSMDLAVRKDGTDFMLFDRWSVVTPLTGFVPVVSEYPVLISGVPLPTAVPNSGFELTAVAYPAIYEAVPSEQKYFQGPPPRQTTVVAQDRTDIEMTNSLTVDLVKFEAKPELLDKLSADANSWLERCLKEGPDSYEDECQYGAENVRGYRPQRNEWLQSFKWSVDERPVVTPAEEGNITPFVATSKVSVEFVEKFGTVERKREANWVVSWSVAVDTATDPPRSTPVIVKWKTAY